LVALAFALAWFHVGLIWYVQLVHYPLIDAWDRGKFRETHERHSRLTGFIVGPTMSVELLLAIRLAWSSPDVVTAISLGLVLVVWLITGFVMVPLHNRLSQGFDERTHVRLMRWNWPRTIAWTARAILLSFGGAATA
jgi:hypothetical protein